MITYQDFLKAQDTVKFISQSIATYMRSDAYKIAVLADEYEAQRNPAIKELVRQVYDITGVAVADPTAANNRIASNYFHRLNTDRCQYSLGNGVSFPGITKNNPDGTQVTVDIIKQQLGGTFDTKLQEAAYYALIHGVSYVFPNQQQYIVFPATQFLPLFDEETGAMRAGIRFWSLEWRRRPIQAVLFEEDGYTKFITAPGKYGLGALQVQEEKRAYRQTVQISAADGEEIIAQSNYGVLPIVPVYASKNKQSTLVGLKEKIDAYDAINSGFANDLQDCAQVYWLINNAQGMEPDDIAKLRDRLIYQHMAVADTTNSTVTPYTQEIPYNARQACLASLRASMYEDFGVLDVHTVAAGATNDHIDAAYQPMDVEADDFEYQLIQAIQQILKVKGIAPAIPQFKRNRISNQTEQTNMVIAAAQYLDDETVLQKLPFVTVDEVSGIMMRRGVDNYSRFETE